MEELFRLVGTVVDQLACGFFRVTVQAIPSKRRWLRLYENAAGPDRLTASGRNCDRSGSAAARAGI
jgi:hypothetical protein